MHMMIEVHLDADPRQWGTGIPQDTVTAACNHLANMVQNYIDDNWPNADSSTGIPAWGPEHQWLNDPDFSAPPPHADIYVTVDDDDDDYDEDADTVDEADVEASIEDFIADNWEAALDAVLREQDEA